MCMSEIGSKFDEHKTFIEIDRFPDVAHALLTKGLSPEVNNGDASRAK